MQYSLGQLVGDRVRRAPLREPRAERVVLREPLAQPVEALGDRLALGEREGLRALVDLDPGDDALRLEQLRERRAVVRALADRLVVEDDAADVLLGAGRREEQVAVGAPVVLGVLDSDRVEALLDRAGALVGGEDPLAVGDERAGDLVQLVLGHAEPLFSPFSVSPEYRARSARPAGKGHNSWIRSGLVRARLESAAQADVAQLVEHQLPKLRVVGSSPIVRFIGTACMGRFLVARADNVLGAKAWVRFGRMRRHTSPTTSCESSTQS